MRRGEKTFEDREDAGRRLAERLAQYRNEDPVILALPRGGVPVGYEISRALNAPLDVFLARKLGAPGREELGIGGSRGHWRRSPGSRPNGSCAISKTGPDERRIAP